MKVLFLDVDGVINSVRSAVAFDGYPWDVDEENIKQFDHVAITLIRRICRDTNCKIILSSTWRRSVGHKKLADALDLPVIDSTPTHMDATRGEEIAAWLRKNEVDKYVIIDDDADMLEEQLPYFVKVDPYNGLSYDNYTKILEILK